MSGEQPHRPSGEARVPDVRALEAEVGASLAGDPGIDDPELVVASADEIGTVVLRGAVASPRQRHAAVHAARQVEGVFEVVDHLDVHPPFSGRRADDELRAAALRRLIADPAIHAGHLHVDVSAGDVTLTGFVGHASERSRAAEDVAGVEGVAAVANRIEVRS